METKQIVAALPLIRRAWRLVPGPWRLPLIVLSAAFWVWNRVRSDQP